MSNATQVARPLSLFNTNVNSPFIPGELKFNCYDNLFDL